MRIPVNTTLDKDLYSNIRILALKLSNNKKINANDLIEEGMQLVLDKYNKEVKINGRWSTVTY